MADFLDWASIEEEIAENNRRISDSVKPTDPEKRLAHWIEMGWCDKDGNPTPDPDDEEEEDDE